MAQRKEKETKKVVKVRDLKPKKDAKGGGTNVSGQHQQTPESPVSPLLKRGWY